MIKKILLTALFSFIFAIQILNLPVAEATTITFYPDPNVEVTSFDGYLEHYYGTWSDMHNATTATNSYDAINDLAIKDYNGGTSYLFNRGFVLFDTSSLPDGAVISSVTLSLYAKSKKR